MLAVELQLIDRLVSFNDHTLRVGRTIAWVLLAMMTFIVLYQVFMRYVLNDAPSWSETAARALMVWMTFLVAPSAYRWGAYVSIETLTHSLRGRSRYTVSLLTNVIALVLIVVMLWLSFDFVDRGFTRRAQGLPAAFLGIPMKAAWIRLAMPVGFLLMTTVAVELIVKDFLRLRHPERADKSPRPDFMLMD